MCFVGVAVAIVTLWYSIGGLGGLWMLLVIDVMGCIGLCI